MGCKVNKFLKKSFKNCVCMYICVCMYVWVWHSCVCGVCTHMYRSQKRMSGALFYCSLLYCVKEKSLFEPGVRPEDSKTQ